MCLPALLLSYPAIVYTNICIDWAVRWHYLHFHISGFKLIIMKTMENYRVTIRSIDDFAYACACAFVIAMLPIIISVSLKWSAFVGNVSIRETNSLSLSVFVLLLFFPGSGFFPNYSDLYFRTKPSSHQSSVTLNDGLSWLTESKLKKNHSKKSNKNLSSSLFSSLLCAFLSVHCAWNAFALSTERKILNCTHKTLTNIILTHDDKQTHDSSLERREKKTVSVLLFPVPGSRLYIEVSDTVPYIVRNGHCNDWILFFLFLSIKSFSNKRKSEEWKKSICTKTVSPVAGNAWHKRMRAEFHCLSIVPQPTTIKINDNNDALAKLCSKLMLKCVCAHYAYRTFDLFLYTKSNRLTTVT